MNTLTLFLNNQFRMVKNSFSLKVLFSGRSLLIFLFLVGYFLGAFELFLWGLNFLVSFPVIGIPVLENLWYFFFFILFIMLIFSNTVIFYSFLHYKKEKDFLFSLPVSGSDIVIKWFFECMVLSSWGFLFLSFPLIVSVGIVMKAGVLYYIGAVIFIILFLILLTSIGLILAFFLVSIKKNSRNILFVFIFASFFLYMLFFILRMPDFIGEGEWPFIVFMTNFFKQLNIFHKIYFPSTWVARALWSIVTGGTKQLIVFGQLLLSTTMLVFCIIIIYAKKKLLPACNQIYYDSKKKSEVRFLWTCSQGGTIWQFAFKDFKAFFRDPRQYFQFIIIISLVILYATNLRGLSEFIDRKFWKVTIYFMNTSALSLTAAAIAIRILFPQMSLEGKRFWLIGLAPMKKFQFVLGKGLPSLFLIILSLGTIMIYSNFMMDLSWKMTLFSLIVLFIMTISLCGMAFGMGMIYPNYKEEDPTKIMSGFGGILTLLLCMLYISLVVGFLGFPFYRYIFGRYANFETFFLVESISFIVVIGLSIAFAFIPLFYGLKDLFKEK